MSNWPETGGFDGWLCGGLRSDSVGFRFGGQGSDSEMPGPRGEQCGKCYFWGHPFGQVDDDSEEVEVASCHRHPPSIPHETERWDVFEQKGVPVDPSAYAWTGANSRSDYWCGEFKPRDASTLDR
jgi:hypothetical protein